MEAPPDPLPGEQPAADAPVVLVVDDNPENLHVIAELLSPYYRVRVANSGPRALQLVAQAPCPELILLDVMMPGMDGHAVIARLKENPATRAIPVIFLTALDSTEDEEKGLELGAVDYITKPLRPAILLSRVRTQLGFFRSRKALERYKDELERRVEERTQKLAQALQAVESASRARSEFLSNMNHEIRTPMNGILGTSELLLASGLNDEQRELAEMTKESADALFVMLRDVLEFAAADSEQQTLVVAPFALGEVIEAISRRFAAPAAAKQLAFACRIAPETPTTLLGDSARLTQILARIVDNAVKFTPAGAVAVEVGPVPAAERAAAQSVWLRFDVRDSGIGIPPEHAERMFQPFTQADASLTRRHGGTGLGLAIASAQISLLRGTITQQPLAGGGTLFRIEVPFVRLQEESAAAGG